MSVMLIHDLPHSTELNSRGMAAVRGASAWAAYVNLN
jgi:hypothetical protein